jgi:hypothetical protein
LALAAQSVLALGIVAFIIGLSVQTGFGMPRHAIVFVDERARTYLAPQCAGTDNRLRATTAGEARDAGFSPDDDCRNDGGFTGDGRSLSGLALVRLGLLKPLQPRWNADGSWNY